MKLRILFACLITMSSAFAEPEKEDERKRAWIDAPKQHVGVRVEDWVKYFGSEYSIEEPSAFKGRHTGDPMATIWLSNGKTRARFKVNLTTNKHFLLVVQSESLEFLREMGVTEVPIDGGNKIRLTVEWDGGHNELNVQSTDTGRLAAVWVYYWD